MAAMIAGNYGSFGCTFFGGSSSRPCSPTRPILASFGKMGNIPRLRRNANILCLVRPLGIRSTDSSLPLAVLVVFTPSPCSISQLPVNACGGSHKDNFIRRLFENYCFVLLTNRAPPQISENRPDMRQRALFVTS